MSVKNEVSEIISGSKSTYYPAWTGLLRGKLLKRYKRFMADVVLDGGETVTAHCPNSGSMKSCSEPGRPVFLSRHDNPKRKLRYTWELIEMPTSMVGVNTIVPNRLVYYSISKGLLLPFAGYDHLKAEKKLESGSRLDLHLWNDEGSQCFIEVKNCTMVNDGVASFPDAVTARGRKHLLELQKLLDANTRSAMLFLIQRSDAGIFRPADAIDPEYGKELRKALKNGVEIHVFDVDIRLDGIRIRRSLPYDL